MEDIIIIGGGKSIQEGLDLNLKEQIKNKCVIGINYCFRHFDITALCFGDRDFYRPLHMKAKESSTPDIYEELGKLDCLIIGARKNEDLDKIAHANTILIPCPKKELGYIPPLSGLFALAIAEKLAPKNIFLLGFDFPRRKREDAFVEGKYCSRSDVETHYYKKEIPHSGLGFMGFYENHNPDNYFKYFNNSLSKIYNVSLLSNIQNFEKISYKQMFEFLNNETFEQSTLRTSISNLLTLPRK